MYDHYVLAERFEAHRAPDQVCLRAGPRRIGWLQLVDANEVEIAERGP